MTDKHVQSEAPHTNMEKDPSTWVTGGEEMTGAQMSYLKTLSEQAGVELDESLTKAEASERIEELQQQTGRGAGSSHGAADHTSHAAAKSKTATGTDASPDTSGAMTGAQMSYLKTLSEQAGVDFDESLTKAAASERIDELQQQTGRGTGHAAAAAPVQHQAAPKAKAKTQTKAAAAATVDDDASDPDEDPRAADDADLFDAETTAAKPARR